MPKKPKDDNPEVSTDSPIVTVRRRMYWYRSGYQRARVGELTSLVSILVLGGATTVSATVAAEAWLTASLAASGVVLNGLRSAFRWHDLGVSRLEAFESLEKTVKE